MKKKVRGLILVIVSLFLTTVVYPGEIGSDFRISDMGVDGNNAYTGSYARVAYNSTDNQYLVVWSGDDNSGSLVDGEFEIWGQLINADGTEDGTDFRISDMGSADGNDSYDALDPHVVYNSADNQFLVVWYGDDNSGSLADNEWEIWGQLINANGTEDGTDFRISDMGSADGVTTYGALFPKASYNSTANNYLVVWEGDDNSGSLTDEEFEIWGQLIGADGSEVGSDFRISTMGADGSSAYDAGNAAIAYNSEDNEYLVVWWGDDNVNGSTVNNEFEIWGRRVNATGILQGSQLRLSDMGPDGDTNYSAISPSVAYSSADNEYVVVWRGDDNTAPLVDGEVEVFGQLLASDGSEFGNDFRISSMGDDGDTSSSANSSRVAYDETNDLFLVVWEGDDASGSMVDNELEVWAQLVESNGTVYGDAVRMSDMGADGNASYDAIAPDVAYNTTDDEFLTIWHGDDNSGSLVDDEYEVWGQLFNAPIPCSLGRYSATGDDGGDRGSCLLCEAGSYQAYTGQTECNPCPTGYFQADAGAILCYACTYGTVQDLTGQASCTNCPVGTYQDEQGQTACKQCAVGYFNATVGEAFCDVCEAGSYTNTVGQSSCTSCAAGTYNNQTTQTSCTSCSAGFFAEGTGNIACTACAAGKYAGDAGAGSCTSCPVGTYTTDEGALVCTVCAAGTFASLEGSSACASCPAGSYSSDTGASACALCSANTYSADVGASSCTACASGYESAEGATACTLVESDTTPPATTSGCQLSVRAQPTQGLGKFALGLLALIFSVIVGRHRFVLKSAS